MPRPAAIATISLQTTVNTGLFLPVEACLNPTVVCNSRQQKL